LFGREENGKMKKKDKSMQHERRDIYWEDLKIEGRAACYMLLSWLAHFYTLKMETIYSSETSVDFYRTAHYIPEDRRLHNNRCEHLSPD
jgi:hypothetical protein